MRLGAAWAALHSVLALPLRGREVPTAGGARGFLSPERPPYPERDPNLAPGEAANPPYELCRPFAQLAGLPENIMFVKTAKTAGSSWGGALRRLACRRGYEDVFLNGTQRFSGGPRRHVLFANHISREELDEKLVSSPRPGANWQTILRDPAERCMSLIYHQALGKGTTLNGSDSTIDSIKIAWMRDPSKCVNQQIKQVRTHPGQTPKEVASEYDFIALQERFDESLVILKHEWGVDLVDMLYLRSKDSSHEDPAREANLEFPHLPLSEESPAVTKAYANLLKTNTDDLELHAIASRRLDTKRAAIPGFADDLALFRSMLATAETECRAEFLVGPAMQPESDCMFGDNGCAQRCINELAERQGW